MARLRGHLQACYLVPDLESVRTFVAVVRRLEPMPAWAEVLTDRPKGRQKALGMTGGLETLHDSLTFTRRLV